MKKQILFAALFGTTLTVGAQGIYQFTDPGFDNTSSWPGSGGYNEWHSFEDAGGSMASFGKGSSPKPSIESTGYDGTGNCIKIYSKSIIGKKANGNLTTGKINMGSTTPANSSNYNYTNNTGDSGKGKCLFAGRPDAVGFWTKFTSGGSEHGRGQFILHDDCAYRDPETADSTNHRVGKAAVYVNPTEEWTYCEGAFTYDRADQPLTQYLLASFTTNPTPGGSNGDYLWIDEVRFIYYHALSALSYDGAAVAGFSEDVTSYDLSGMTYDESKLAYTKKGVGATVEKSYDKVTCVLTITVKGNDYAADNTSLTTYTVQFAKPEHALASLSYDGTPIEGFAPTTTSYDLSSVKYDESKLTYTLQGVGATAETSFDAATCQLTIKVKGYNYASDNTSFTTYTVQFAKPGHTLTSLSYDGTPISNFAEDVTDYDMGSAVEYDPEAELTYTLSDETATVDTTFNAETFTLTIHVAASNIEADATAYTDYTLRFAKTTGIVSALAPAASASSAEVYTLSGIRVSGKLSALPKGVYLVNGKKKIIK